MFQANHPWRITRSEDGATTHTWHSRSSWQRVSAGDDKEMVMSIAVQPLSQGVVSKNATGRQKRLQERRDDRRDEKQDRREDRRDRRN